MGGKRIPFSLEFPCLRERSHLKSVLKYISGVGTARVGDHSANIDRTIDITLKYNMGWPWRVSNGKYCSLRLGTMSCTKRVETVACINGPAKRGCGGHDVLYGLYNVSRSN